MKTNYSLCYAAAGHALMHMFAAFYFVIVLAIEKSWNIPYEILLKLWFLGSLMIGIAAIPAGLLSDKWSRSGMIVIMFFGMGVSSIFCGLSSNTTMLFISLSFLGLFCAIYHPVAIAWIVNSSTKRGMALGINGIFGTAGVGLGGLVAGSLLELGNWQTAFIVPAIFSILAGCGLFYHILTNKIAYKNIPNPREKKTKKDFSTFKIAIIFLISIFCLGLIFQITQTSVPKLLEMRFAEKLQFKVSQIGILVAVIYGFSGIASLLGGYLADRYNLKKIYITGIILQAPFLFLVSQTFNVSIVVFLLFTVTFNTMILPAENMLLANFSPQKYHGLIYGFKFILAFGSAPVAILFVATFFKIYQDFSYLFILSGCLMAMIFLVALFLPNKKLI